MRLVLTSLEANKQLKREALVTQLRDEAVPFLLGWWGLVNHPPNGFARASCLRTEKKAFSVGAHAYLMWKGYLGCLTCGRNTSCSTFSSGEAWRKFGRNMVGVERQAKPVTSWLLVYLKTLPSFYVWDVVCDWWSLIVQGKLGKCLFQVKLEKGIE